MLAEKGVGKLPGLTMAQSRNNAPMMMKKPENYSRFFKPRLLDLHKCVKPT